jgi:GNAT superfamily N-acetyltransferase
MNGNDVSVPVVLRHEVDAFDVAAIRNLVDATGYFNAAETAIAAELVQDRLERRDTSGYHFVVAERAGRVVGYTCYGPIEGTQVSFDLFWIAVHPDQQGGGLGRLLMAEAERLIHGMGGRRVYVETSGRAQYASTRAFYLRIGYEREAELRDFYGPGDAKVFFVKVLG